VSALQEAGELAEISLQAFPKNSLSVTSPRWHSVADCSTVGNQVATGKAPSPMVRWVHYYGLVYIKCRSCYTL